MYFLLLRWLYLLEVREGYTMNEAISIASFSPERQTVTSCVVSSVEEVIQKVWDRATGVIGYDPKVWRKDQCGAWICRTEYGNRNSVYGWEIDHLRPVAEGGSNKLLNLRPLHWENYLGRIQIQEITPQ